MPEKVPRKLRSIKKTTTIEFEIELNVWKGLPKREGGRCRSTHIVKVAEPFQIGQLVVVIVVRAMSQHIRFLVGRKLMRCVCRLIASRLTIELKEDEEGGGREDKKRRTVSKKLEANSISFSGFNLHSKPVKGDADFRLHSRSLCCCNYYRFTCCCCC